MKERVTHENGINVSLKVHPATAAASHCDNCNDMADSWGLSCNV